LSCGDHTVYSIQWHVQIKLKMMIYNDPKSETEYTVAIIYGLLGTSTLAL